MTYPINDNFDFENEPKFTCCLCGKKYMGYSNNPYPIMSRSDKVDGCCDACDRLYVIPVRLQTGYGNEDLAKELYQQMSEAVCNGA